MAHSAMIWIYAICGITIRTILMIWCIHRLRLVKIRFSEFIFIYACTFFADTSLSFFNIVFNFFVKNYNSVFAAQFSY